MVESNRIKLAALAASLTLVVGACDLPDSGGETRDVLMAADVDLALRVAQARQRFGSVTQSSNVDGSRRTIDRANVTSARGGLRLQVFGANRVERFSLDTRAHGDTVEDLGDAKRYTMIRQGSFGVVGALVFDAPGRGISIGYWARLDSLASQSPEELGIFIDGGEQFSREAGESWSRPAGATFRGGGQGLTHYRDGSTEATREVYADICMLVTPDTVTAYLYSADQDNPWRADLAVASIAADGTFDRVGPIVVDDEFGTSSVDGSWGGAFADDAGEIIVTLGAGIGERAAVALLMFHAEPRGASACQP